MQRRPGFQPGPQTPITPLGCCEDVANSSRGRGRWAQAHGAPWVTPKMQVTPNLQSQSPALFLTASPVPGVQTLPIT